MALGLQQTAISPAAASFQCCDPPPRLVPQVEGLVEDALRRGAALAAGGARAALPGRLAGGHFFEPTVLTGRRQGPALAVLSALLACLFAAAD